MKKISFRNVLIPDRFAKIIIWLYSILFGQLPISVTSKLFSG